MHCSLTFHSDNTVFLVDTINTVSKNRHSLLIAIAVMDTRNTVQYTVYYVARSSEDYILYYILTTVLRGE
jgi:hypothetical protein